MKLASSSDNIQAAVLLHPGPITDDEINGKLVVSCVIRMRIVTVMGMIVLLMFFCRSQGSYSYLGI